MAPVGTPPEVIETINRQVNAILREPESAQWFAARRHFVLGGTSAEFAATLRADYARWADLVRDARIRSE
jgi:tripartite-type tricarboxylate transporter receptor subunit TctC